MKKTILAILILTALAILYISGPEIKSDMSVPETESIENPEKYISDKESAIHDMRPENNKQIVWAENPGEKTRYSIVYIHGFTASRNETAPLTEIIAEQTGSNIFYTRLKGHGRYELKSQENVSISDWLYDAEEALGIGKILGEKVIIISCSTGTALASWLSENHPSEIAAHIMISPNFEPADKRIFFLLHKWGPVLAKILEGEIIGENEHIISPEHANNWSWIYKTEMVFPVAALLKYIENTDFSEFRTPVIMFYCPEDRIVNQKKTLEVFSTWGTDNKEIYKIENPGDRNGHLIAGDIFSPETTSFVAEKSLNFIKKNIF